MCISQLCSGSPVFDEELVITITGDISSNTKDELRVYLVGEGEKQELGIKAVANRDAAEWEIRARFIGGEKGLSSYLHSEDSIPPSIRGVYFPYLR